MLNAELEEEIYMRLPEGQRKYNKKGVEYVAKLLKSLYGLKQAPRAWNKEIVKTLLALGFTQSKTDGCIFTYNRGVVYCILGLYVDDIVLACSDDMWYEDFKRVLNSKYKIQDLGKIEHLLGIEIKQGPEFTELSQSKYITELVHKFEVEDLEPKQVPIDASFKITLEGISEEDVKAAKNYPYKSLVGALLWISRGTRPDISAAVGILSKFTHCYTKKHWDQLVGVLLYLKGTPNFCIKYSRVPICEKGPNFVTCFADASYADNKINARSTSGYIIMMNDGPISWYSKQQSGVTHSTSEAEYMAQGTGAMELIYIYELLHCFGIIHHGPMQMYGDNTGCVYMMKNPKMSEKTRHIRVKYHYVRELVEEAMVSITFIRTKYMLADLLTKAVTKEVLQNLRKFIVHEKQL
jgi:hypothetical protein